MPLPQHLQPRTYWENRAELMEESVWRLANILIPYLPPQGGNEVVNHMIQWRELIKKLELNHPPQQETT